MHLVNAKHRKFTEMKLNEVTVTWCIDAIVLH